MTALTGLRVLDLSDGVAGQFCGRMLADAGATVLLSEAEGRCTVHVPPFDDRGRSLTHLHLNLGKRSVGPEAVADQAQQADVILCGAGQGAGFRVRAPKAIVAEVSGFGADGPCADWQAPEIVLQAVSGMMNANGTLGREPLYGTGQRASYSAGVAAYIAVMAALLARRRTGLGDLIRVDAAETAAAMAFPYLQQHIYNGTDRRRGTQDQPFGLVECQGAWVCIWVYSNRFRRLCEALDLHDCFSDPQFTDLRERSGNWQAFFDRVRPVVRDRDPDELVADLQALDIISARAYRVSELRKDRHLAERGIWRRVTVDGVDYVVPAPAFRYSLTPVIAHGEPA